MRFFRALFITIGIIVFMGWLSSCGQGSDEKGSWLKITSYPETSSNMEVSISGEVVLREECFDAGVTVNATNITNGWSTQPEEYIPVGHFTGDLSDPELECLIIFWFMPWVCAEDMVWVYDYHRWNVQMPITHGDNEIIITASDAPCGNRDAMDSVVINHPDHQPIIHTLISSATATGINVNLEVDTGGLATDLWFEYVMTYPDDPYSQTTIYYLDPIPAVLSSNYTIGGLNPGRGYYFKAIAENDLGRDESDLQVETLPAIPPTIGTATVSQTGNTFANVYTFVNANGKMTKAWMEYGTYMDNLIFQTESTYYFSQQDYQTWGSPTQLQPDTIYYFRFVAENEMGQTIGPIGTFTTLP